MTWESLPKSLISLVGPQGLEPGTKGLWGQTSKENH